MAPYLTYGRQLPKIEMSHTKLNDAPALVLVALAAACFLGRSYESAGALASAPGTSIPLETAPAAAPPALPY